MENGEVFWGAVIASLIWAFAWVRVTRIKCGAESEGWRWRKKKKQQNAAF